MRRFIALYAEKSESWPAENQPKYREWIEWAHRPTDRLDPFVLERPTSVVDRKHELDSSGSLVAVFLTVKARDYLGLWGKPNLDRCSAQLSGMSWHNFSKVRSGGWHPSRIDSIMSGARNAHAKTFPT